MKRVCVIGSSHAGALRLAIRQGWSDPELKFSFFAIHGSLHPYLHLENGLLFARKVEKVQTDIEGAATRGIDVAGFDAVVLSGWGMPNALAKFLDKTHPLTEARCANWQTSAEVSLPMVSRSVMFEVVVDRLRALYVLHTLRHLVSVFSGPIIVQQKPKPGIVIFEDPEWLLRRTYGENAARVYAEFIQMLHRATLEIFSTLTREPLLLPHPDVEGGMPHAIPDAFSVSPTDGWHKNGKYGGIVLDQVRDKLL